MPNCLCLALLLLLSFYLLYLISFLLVKSVSTLGIPFSPIFWILKPCACFKCRRVNGNFELLPYKMIGFHVWTEIDADAAVMREALEEYLEL